MQRHSATHSTLLVQELKRINDDLAAKVDDDTKLRDIDLSQENSEKHDFASFRVQLYCSPSNLVTLVSKAHHPEANMPDP